ncbi:MAG: hypothetical protein Tsb0019_36180 [Roseibium sp.]
MARAMTVTTESVSRGAKQHRRAERAGLHDETLGLPGLLVKNLLFWGSVSLSLYGLYALVAAL